MRVMCCSVTPWTHISYIGVVVVNNIRVFVYGTLKAGGSDRGLNMWGDDVTYVSDGVTKEGQFSMVDLGAFPGVILGGESDISGEIWMVNSEAMRMLDDMEGYPHFYNRRKTQTSGGTAWMYYLPAQEAEDYPEIVPQGGIITWNGRNQ